MLSILKNPWRAMKEMRAKKRQQIYEEYTENLQRESLLASYLCDNAAQSLEEEVRVNQEEFFPEPEFHPHEPFEEELNATEPVEDSMRETTQGNVRESAIDLYLYEQDLRSKRLGILPYVPRENDIVGANPQSVEPANIKPIQIAEPVESHLAIRSHPTPQRSSRDGDLYVEPIEVDTTEYGVVRERTGESSSWSRPSRIDLQPQRCHPQPDRRRPLMTTTQRHWDELNAWSLNVSAAESDGRAVSRSSERTKPRAGPSYSRTPLESPEPQIRHSPQDSPKKKECLKQLSDILPMTEQEIRKMLDYTLALSQDGAIQYLTEFLGDSALANEFIDFFNSPEEPLRTPSLLNVRISEGMSAEAQGKRVALRENDQVATPRPRRSGSSRAQQPDNAYGLHPRAQEKRTPSPFHPLIHPQTSSTQEYELLPAKAYDPSEARANRLLVRHRNLQQASQQAVGRY